MKKLKLMLAGFLVFGGLAAALPAPAASAVNVFDRACTPNSSSSALCSNRNDNASGMAQPIISALFLVIGIVSVIVIIVGGIMYAVSTGDPGKTKRAKDTILYAVVGLVVAIMAYGIVTFVVNQF